MNSFDIDQKAKAQINNLLDNCDLLQNDCFKKLPSDFNFQNETILITGAAGSVGSELSKQLLEFKFKSLILIDNAESPLYNLVKDLNLENKVNVEIVLIDIRDEEAMAWFFTKYTPSIVFHAAAYKHVPLMEENAYEAVRLNIFATKILADLSLKHEVKKFVFISTDKAVNPINVMGMTKRIAESYLNYLNIYEKTSFKSTRFGNIFGSNGSVVPIFLKQIYAGKPISITSYDTTRYFINKNKAGYLILQVASLNKNDGFLFTFNMGNPIKIIDLAKTLVGRVCKTSTYKFEMTGLRPGEKVHEDLVSKNEYLELTKHKEILKVASVNQNITERISFNLLSTVRSDTDNSDIKAVLRNCVEKLQSSPTFLFAI